MTTSRQIFYSGRVQGVGFRYTVKQIASGYEVIGWVRNLPDGRVELLAGGEAGELDAFHQRHRRESSGSIHQSNSERGGGTALGVGCIGFEIRTLNGC